MTIAEAIHKSTAKVIYLFEITAGLGFVSWIATGGIHPNVYQVATALEVVSVKWNLTTTLTQQTSIADVNSNQGSWYSDGAALYVRPPTGQLIYGSSVQAFTRFYFSNSSKTLADRFYDPRLLSEPTLSLRIERSFSGVGQVGGGSVSFANADRYFNQFGAMQWDAGAVTLKLGIDSATVEMDFADYETIATWVIDEWDLGDEFRLKLSEPKSRLKRKLPISVYTRTNYPSMREGDAGKPIPIAYGKLVSVAPALVHQSSKIFKVAGHAIKSFDAVKIRSGSSDSWATINFASQDTSLGQFTLGSEFTGNEEVAVDFTGKVDGSGDLISNPADIVEDILLRVGETNINAASFSAAYHKLDIGYNEEGERVITRSPSIYIDTQVEAVSVLGEINKLVGSYLFSDATGQFFYGVFEPEPGEDLETFNDLDLLGITETTNAADTFSKVFAEYQIRKQEDYSQLTEQERTGNQFLHNSPAEVVKNVELGFHELADADLWAQRHLVFDGQPYRKVSVKLTWRGILLQPGTFIRIESERYNVNEVFEILEVKRELKSKTVSLTLSDNRNLKDTAGFWRDDPDALPVRFADLAGYGSGSLDWNDAWDPLIKKWAHQNVGYWQDENGFASSTDLESFNTTVFI